ncbi:MAG: ABC transporter ATP-binding protein/permease, partial [Planctomycetaceae bacterium]|nr:ABC transporter ATP-binding protein/permease [Planctomycetaceae bacterium]
NVRENIDFYGGVYGLEGERLEQRRRDVLDLTALGDRTDQLAGTLSGGWKQRLALACALVHEPALLFLDEPTAGIDPVARRDLWDLLFRLAGEGVTLLVTTHYMDEAERCSRVGYIYNSHLIALGTPGELKQHTDVTPSGARRWELVVPDPVKSLTELRKDEQVRDATFFGQAIHVLASSDWQPPQTQTSIGGEGGEPIDAREIPPSLEDVFVSLTRRYSGANPPPPPDLSASDQENPVRNETSDQDLPTGRSKALPAESTSLSTKHGGAGSSLNSGRRPSSLFGFAAILGKEFAHIRRQPSTLVFALVVPVLQTFIFGVAIDTEIEHIPMVVYDLDGRQSGRDLASAFENTRTFQIVDRVYSETEFQSSAHNGYELVGLRIPPDFSDQLLAGEQAHVQVLIDGSDSQVATTALQASNLLGLNLSLARTRPFVDSLPHVPSRTAEGRAGLPIEVRARLLYNPNLESSHFFVPGLVGIILQLVTLFLTSFAIVRERELGTLEQLFVTPVSRAGLLLGKLVPYAILGFVETLIVLCVMVYVFHVPIRGDLVTLVTLSMLFLVCGLGLGLLVSTIARTQVSAIQFAFLIMLPSILLSGFVFPREEMPLPIYWITFGIPVTHYVEVLRGLVLRGADFRDLIPQTISLILSAIVILGLALSRFRKQVG